MTKNLKIGLVVTLSLVGIGIQVNAQEDTMKTLPPVVISTSSNINKTVEKAFNENFKDAMDPKWLKMNENYFVTFISGDVKNNVLFRKNGRIIYHMQFGTEKNLPDDVRQQIQAVYADYEITRAVLVKVEDRSIWVVNLEGLKKLVIVSVENGELSEAKSYTKSS